MFPEHISMFFLKDADILFHLCPLPVNTLQLPLRHQEKIRLPFGYSVKKTNFVIQ